MNDDLFDFSGDAEQQENIERVFRKIAPIINMFFHELGIGAEFHVDQLRRYAIASYPEIAPDSAGRIMRNMRQRGWIDYVVVNRRASLYRVTGLGNES